MPASPYGSAGFGQGSGGSAGRGPAGQYMPEVPLQWSNFTGWSPAGPNPAIAQKRAADFAMQNRPTRVQPPLGANKQIFNPDWSPADQGGGGGLGGLGLGLGITGTGIQSGGVPQSAMNDAQGMLGFSQAPGVPAGGASGFLNQQFNDMGSQLRHAASTDLTRRGAYENSILDLAMQRARADETVGMGDLWRRLRGLNLANQDFGQGILFGALGG